MIAKIEFEKGMACDGIFKVIVGKLRYQQELYPVVLLLIYEGTKVSSYCAFQPFCLPICLRVKYGRKLMFDSEKVIEQESKLRCKICSTVTND